MTVHIDMGADTAGRPALLDLEELLATRLLVQGNSGSGKSHLLRRLLERSAEWVQQVVIDPEGDFVTLADRFGHVVVNAAELAEGEIRRVAARIRAHRVSVVLSLEGLEIDAQMRCAATFLNALFDAPREHWYPALVVVDEAQLFAPAAAGEVSDEARRQSLSAMTNLMCRGRKRGLAGVIATQRLAKLAKNVAAEASNFLMGRTFLDIDMARAADLLGMERRQAEAIRDLERGHFLALGPALSRRPLPVRIGAVETGTRGGGPKLMAPPVTTAADAQSLLFARLDDEPEPPIPAAPKPSPEAAEALMKAIAAPQPKSLGTAPAPDLFAAAAGLEVAAQALREIVADPEAALRPAAVLYQDFGVRCRIAGVPNPPLDLAAFKRRLALARAGFFEDPAGDPAWAGLMPVVQSLPEDVQGVYLYLARAARDGGDCPDDEALARVYGTASTGRARRLVTFLEQQGAIVVRTDLGGRRQLLLPRAHAEALEG